MLRRGSVLIPGSSGPGVSPLMVLRCGPEVSMSMAFGMASSMFILVESPVVASPPHME
jgi:hypothetical protein